MYDHVEACLSQAKSVVSDLEEQEGLIISP